MINDDKNTIIILASYPCGSCQILVRIIQQIQMYLSFNLSIPNQNRLRFLHLDVRKNQGYNYYFIYYLYSNKIKLVPVILQFDRLPQLLVYPKTSDGFKVKKSIVFDMNYEMNFKNVLKWLIASLGKIDYIRIFFPSTRLQSEFMLILNQ